MASSVSSRRILAERSGVPGPVDADPEFLAALGQRVREIREQRGIVRKTLSHQAQVSERYLAALESGEGNASVVLLRRVAGALGVRLVDLLDAGDLSAE